MKYISIELVFSFDLKSSNEFQYFLFDPENGEEIITSHQSKYFKDSD